VTIDDGGAAHDMLVGEDVAEYKIFLDAMQTKETRIVAFRGETGLGLHHLALLARPWVYAHSRPEIFTSLALRDWIDGV
jgi:hypothetical protein